MSWQITVHIKQQFISCTPKGGHVKAKNEDQFQWRSPDAPFTLVFEDFVTGAKLWPFVEPPQEPTWPVTDTKILTLKKTGIPRYYKYTVKSAGCTDLDPIIIVDN